MTKVTVIGTGFVGTASAYAIALQGVCSDLLLIDLNKDKSRAEALDISHAAAVASGVRVHSGDYEAMKGSAVVVIAAGVNQKPGESRLDLLERNAKIFQSIIPQINQYAADAILVVATNPVDILTDFAQHLFHNPRAVIGTGTVLDTARFRDLLGRETGVSPRHIHANVLGEHGDTSVLTWSSAKIAGQSIAEVMAEMNKPWGQEQENLIEQKVRGAAATIIAGKQATYYGIGAAVMKIVSEILKDSHAVVTVSVANDLGICLSLPVVINRQGVFKILSPQLSQQEHEQLEESAKILKDTRSAISHLING